jgi:hypothetical protein
MTCLDESGCEQGIGLIETLEAEVDKLGVIVSKLAVLINVLKLIIFFYFPIVKVDSPEMVGCSKISLTDSFY